MLNMEMLRDFFGDEGEIREILAQFVETTDSDIQQLEQAIEERDIGQVAELAHRIKGASQVIGAADLVRAVGELEADARTHDDHCFDELYAALAETYRHVSEEIQSL
ncbi:Hpt domain-containing protein [Kistimonas asteriae]|uniref:Hpt domain-containing protein n=1 Tax=Kistimonas asteriae TaxID=517724 RepID=UPI001BA99A96|nr:Hpt domain-containing protein [Kistimonas asteriae]